MKKTLRILSVICAIVLIFGTMSVGMSAYAVADDIIGSYDYNITNVYKDIDWDNVTAYKSETHVHTVRSDADEEINRMIRNYYNLGYDAMALTDHGTINYGWDHDQSRLAIFEYQYFVHGATDELGEDEYKQIITGAKARTINSGKGMMEIPLGIELNGMSTVKCHVNGFYADADHGGLGLTEDWPRNAVKTYYNGGGFTHINHVGEWSEGNNEPEVYTKGFINDFVSIFEDYCPNRGGRNSAAQTAWVSSHKPYAGVIGMELVNTADSRTRNDRRLVYDESLKKLAPQGINMFGFCEDDSHEPSDCDRNAQYILINNNKDVQITSSQFDQSNNTSGETSDYKNNDSDPIDKVQNYYRDALYYGEFYASSKNSKNSYELGDGFNAVGNYPSISDISVDDPKNQISVTFQDATKIRMVADGEVVESFRTGTGTNTVTFDLNRNEDKINSYVRIYLTGPGGITYLQPFILEKITAEKSTVQFITTSNDVNIEVKSNGTVVDESCKYENNYYILPAGDYTYTATRRGYEPKEGEFSVAQAQIDAHEQIKINVGELTELSGASYAYFYTPETIYVNPSDNQTFQYYVDRANVENGAVHNEVQTTGNIFFKREGASDINLEYEVVDGATRVSSMTIGSLSTSGDTLATSITAGSLAAALANDQFVYIKWTLTYTYKTMQYEAISYTYVYKPKTDNSSVIAAGGSGKTGRHIIEWAHSPMQAQATVFVSGLHKLESTNGYGYKFAPGNNNTPTDSWTGKDHDESDALRVTGQGYQFTHKGSSGGSAEGLTNNGDAAYIYADRSRIQNWSQIPYLKIGLDINTTEQLTGENCSTRGAIRLGYDIPITSIKTYNQSYAGKNYLFDREYTTATNYSQTIDYNLDDDSFDNPTSGSQALSSLSSGRIYMADNESSNQKFIKELPDAKTQESEIPISAYLLGSKEGRTDEATVGVKIRLVNVDKSGLRTEFNNTVKGGFQADWFQSIEEWYQYQNTIAAAGKVLGNPASDPEQIEEAKQSLIDAVDNFHLKTGTVTIENRWRINGEEGLINQEPTFTYVYGDDITATAKLITGYSYNSEYDFFVENTQVYSFYDNQKHYTNSTYVEDGNADYDLAFAEKGSYKWIFYYTPNTYHATYNLNGGTDATGEIAAAQNTAVYFGQQFTPVNQAPARVGYQFNNWYLDVKQKSYGAGEPFKWDYAGDGEFTAYWTPNVYNITYDVNGGDTLSIGNKYKTATYGDTYYICPSVPTNTGYKFIGWALNGDTTEEGRHTPGSNLFYDIAADSEFTAQWEIADYTVRFVTGASDATLDMESISVRFNEPYGTLATATRTGYTYEWYSDGSGRWPNNAKVTATTIVGIAADHELYAKWTPIDYTITYNLDGGSAPSNPTTYNVESERITLDRPTKTGYEFTGWSGTLITGNYQLDGVIPECTTGNLTFNANWEISGYKIHYYGLDELYPNTANDARNPSSYKVTESVTLYAPTRTGYEFLGWTGSNNETTPEAIVTIPVNSTGDKEYTAHWSEPEVYNITYDYDGGATTLPSDNPDTYTVEDSEFTLVLPKKTGYEFNGWNCSNDSLDGMSVTVVPGTITGDLTFKALWREADAHDVIYVLNGGRVEGANPTSYKTGSTYTLISPKKDGYTFANWTKTIDDVADNENPSIIAATDDGTIVFTANWSVNNNTITYNLDGGKVVADGQNPVSYTAESAPITLLNPIKPGYTFQGWTGTGLTGATRTVVIPTGSYGDRAYTATWKIDDYTITYEFNGGTDTGLIKSYRPTTEAEIGAPVRPGYTFTGWNIAFHSFDWTEGTVNNTGTFTAQTGSYYSNPVSLQSGTSYSIESSVSGLRLCVFSSDGASFSGSYTGTYTAAADCIAFIVADGAQAQNLRTVKLNLSGTPASYLINKDGKAQIAGDMQFTANWSGDEYDITYEGLDENCTFAGTNPLTYTYDSSDILLINPEKSGYTFNGWEYNGAVSKSTVIKNHSTGDRTYTAQWEIANYTITYRGLEGAVDPNNRTTYTVNDAFTLVNPTKTGYTFAGWVGAGITGASNNVSIAAGTTGNKTYTATWSADTYLITYDLDGGTATNPTTYTIEDSFTLANPTRSGAVFTGWEGTGINGTSTNVTVAKGSTGARAYTAKWNITEYTIAYELNGGTETTNPATYNVTSANITLAQPVRTGYSFAGWTGTGLDTATAVVTIPTGSVGNRTYEATWEKVGYSISYDLDGGRVATNANPASYDIETATITLVNPEKPGYTFTGWTGTGLNALTTTVRIPMGSTGNRTYTANWEESGYSITYLGIEPTDTFEGENRTFYTIVTNDFTLYNPSRTGYKFDGWSGTGISDTGVSDSVTVVKGSSGDRTYTANWSLATYTITYELDGGTDGGLVNPTSYTYLSAPITLYNPIKTGYDFVGWQSDYYSETLATVTIPTNSTGDKTFTAVWGAGDYTITLDPDGGTLPAGQASSIDYTYEDRIEIQNPTKEGFTFGGWIGTGITGSVTDLVIESGSTGNRAYKATWVSGANVITYNLDGGEVTKGNNPSSYVTNSGTLTIASPTKVGYKFTGWEYDNSDIVNVNSITKVAKIDTAAGGSVNFKATWSPITYNIYYNYNLETDNPNNVIPSNNTTYTIKDTFTLSNPVREGYTFAGWSGTDLGDYKIMSVTVSEKTGARTYTANWTEENYKITYNYNGGSTSKANPLNYTVLTPSFTLNNPEKTGYTFTGWTEPGVTTEPVTVVTVSSGSTGNRTFVANFDPIEYTITYKGTEGVDQTLVDSLTTSYTADDRVEIPDLTRAGYDFLGWKSTDSLDPVKEIVLDYGSSGDREYTAQWSTKEYTITYVLDGGTVNGDNPVKYTAESPKIVLINPTKDGYAFSGWVENEWDSDEEEWVIDENAEPSSTMIINKGSTGNKQFTAVWGAQQFTITYSGLENVDVASLHLPQTYTSAETVTIPQPAKPGYRFTGWTGTGLGEATPNVTILKDSSGNRAYTATWMIINYELNVDLDGGEANREIPKTYTVESDKIVLPTPTKTDYSFAGWENLDDGTVKATVEILKGSTGNRNYIATWKDKDDNNHKIFFHGYKDYPIILNPETGKNYIEVALNTTINVTYDKNGYPATISAVDVNDGIVECNIEETVGYKITGWDKDFNSDYYRNLNNDIHVYAEWEVGSKTYSVTVNGTKAYTKTCGQYELFTASTDAYSNGQQFLYWVINGTNEVISYYRNYSFYVHSEISLSAVYGVPSGPRATTRVSNIEGYDSNYDWFTVYTERNIATEYTLVQHGLIFTVNEASSSESTLVIGSADVFNAVSSLSGLTGMWTISIMNPYKFGFGKTVYLRSYVKVADENGRVTTAYSPIKTYVNDEDLPAYNNQTNA